MRGFRKLALGAMMLVVVLAACSSGGGSKPAIKIGSDGFYEAKLMAEIYGQALEANGYTVNRDGIGIGTRAVSQPALESGQFDLKPEYIGSGLANLKGTPTGDPAANAKALGDALAAKGCPANASPTPSCGISVLNYTPAQDQNAFVVRKETADQYKLTKMSDLTAVASQLKFGVATDCDTNPVCGAALQSAYGIDVTAATKLDACSTPMAQALLGKTIDVGELCSTQPDIAVNGFVLLVDDKATQPADNIAPLIRNDFLAKTDKTAFSKILNDVSAKMDTATLTDLGKQISVDKKDIPVVAKAWLQKNGFVK
jgi:osmoprotectant transport system substrate-binding protein